MLVRVVLGRRNKPEAEGGPVVIGTTLRHFDMILNFRVFMHQIVFKVIHLASLCV